MKAQISFVEYLIAFVIFVAFVGFFSFQTLKFVSEYLNQIRSERIRAEAYQISEILVNDIGDPSDWNNYIGTPNEYTIKRVGLSDQNFNKTNVLLQDKINKFNSKCSNDYSAIKKWLASDYDFSIILIRKSSPEAVLINCHPTVTAVRTINTTVRRIVSFDSGYGELIIQMW
jgi:hypothetical protein